MNYVITNFDSLLLFADKALILTSSIVYYHKQIENMVAANHFDFKPILRNISIYLYTLTKELVRHTKNVGYELNHFYLFDTTKKHLTKKQKSFAEYLEKQVLDLASLYDIPIEIGFLQVCRERVVGDIAKFEACLKSLPKPENIIEKIQLSKLSKICEYIAYRSELKY